MKINKIISLIVALIFSTTFFGQSWDLVWEENFSGTTLNDSVWTHEIGSGSQYGLWGWGNGEQQFYQASNSEVSNGQLKITAKQEPNGLIDSWGSSYYISSSRIVSRDKMEFRYGKVEARIKTVNGEGFWPAFWMLPSG
ncbi:MAG: glycoside hydrolase family 16 protein, partial [Flavobacteriales bacterium]